MGRKAYFDSERSRSFLDKDKPVCREERQFALFLYNVFLEKKRNRANAYENEVVEKCLFEKKEKVDLESVYIKDVYFEATLMRDHFDACKDHEEKARFNEKLLDLCLDWLGKDKENVVDNLKEKLGDEKDGIWQNMGHACVKKAINEAYPSIKQEIEKQDGGYPSIDLQKRAWQKACLQIAGMMMNATPDLLVIYGYEGKLYAKALECKYLSTEGRYADAADTKIRMQYFIQECIMKFCFGPCVHEAYIKEHIPKCPTKGMWKDKEVLWESLCKAVYEGILLKSEDDDNGAEGRVDNRGVGVILFERQENKDKKEQTSEIRIPVKDLLANMYHDP